MKRILIANRGEIAVRIILACRKLGIESIAVYTEADSNSLHVLQADKAVKIGPSATSLSYLNQNALMHVAKSYQCDGIHPGYGFLSENPAFARFCEAEGIQFIGPSSHCIRVMGDKMRARLECQKYGIPVVPGSAEACDQVEISKLQLQSIGLPVLIKARGGGGGRGMRIVREEKKFESDFLQAAEESKAAFSDSALYLEKYFERVRHVEVQILGDQSGKCIALGERECTVQRRYQKLVEESPCFVLGNQLRSALHEQAVKLAEAIGYVGAGTVEFIVTEELDQFYFIEMNTRIQVEHPVTEMLYGIDLVETQLQLATGVSLTELITNQGPTGHAIEFRINAEDWESDFQPSPGLIRKWKLPAGSGIRVDTHVYESLPIGVHYDSMIGKLIVHGHDREQALSRAETALQDFEVDGVSTTIGFHSKLVTSKAFRSCNFYTKWVEEEFLRSS